MGQTGSRMVSKIANSFTFHGSPSEEMSCEEASNAVTRFKGTPFVYSRRGSMYFDEDGDLAHEFYEEFKNKRGRRKMRRVDRGLRPQGEVKYSCPRLNVDFPIILYSDQMGRYPNFPIRVPILPHLDTRTSSYGYPYFPSGYLYFPSRYLYFTI